MFSARMSDHGLIQLRRPSRLLGAVLALVAVGAAGRAEPAPSAGPPRATVFAVHDAAATTHFVPNAAVVRGMVERGLGALAGRPDAASAWRTLVRSNDVIGFKVTAGPGEISGTRPIVVRALVESLLAAGHPAAGIVIWDKRATDLRRAGWCALADELGVRCLASEDAGWDPDPAKAYEKPVLGRLVAGDLEFNRRDQDNAGRRSYVSRLLTRELTKIIPVTPVLSHNLAGVNGQLAGLALGSVDNTLRFQNNPGLIAEVVPEICALDDVIAKVPFGVSDALVCQYRGEDTTRLHNAFALNELRFSRARANADDGGGNSFKTDVFANAELLELGVANLKRITVTRVGP